MICEKAYNYSVIREIAKKKLNKNKSKNKIHDTFIGHHVLHLNKYNLNERYRILRGCLHDTRIILALASS